MAISGTKISLDKYEASDIVWLATALLTMELYDSSRSHSKISYYFAESDIIKKSKKLSNAKIDTETIRECSRDKKRYDCHYGDNGGGPRVLFLRIKFPMEQGEDTIPKKLNPNDLVLKNKKMIPMTDLIDFVREQYPAIIQGTSVPKAKKNHEKSDTPTHMSNKKESESDAMYATEFSKNTILYGPPGTGKTYNSAIYAVAICDNRSLESVEKMEYEDVMKRYKELIADNRIAFTTFHQSYGYEEFIEGIKPIIGESTDSISYTIEDGVFKSFCKSAILPEDESFNPNSKIWKITLKQPGDNTLKQECFKDGTIKFNWESLEDCKGRQDFYLVRQFKEKLKVGDVVVSYHGSKTYIDGVGIVTGDAIYDATKKDFKWSRNVEWIYQGLPINIQALNDNKSFAGDEIYELKRVKIHELFNLIRPQHCVTNNKNFVFIIDEINRGNISKIFGELITLIEDTKRTGMMEEASAILPYSNENFSVPSNVYILGTMNTADRSIALMDTALRRRFEFIEKMPDADVLRNIGADHVGGIDIAAILEKINERITFLYDREHTIGHAFFTKLASDPSIENLASIFEKSVIPLLQEYFYEDYQKIQLVLGDNGKRNDAHKFILDIEVKPKDIFKGHVEDVIDLPEKKYIINQTAFLDIESYKEII